MAELKLLVLEVGGDPLSAQGFLPVRLVYADAASAEAARFHLEIRALCEAGYGDALAEVEEAALLQAKNLVAARARSLAAAKTGRA